MFQSRRVQRKREKEGRKERKNKDRKKTEGRKEEKERHNEREKKEEPPTHPQCKELTSYQEYRTAFKKKKNHLIKK